MLEHYRGLFGKDEGLVLEEYRRAGIETKSDTIDCNSGIHKRMEEKAKQRTKRMVVLKNTDTRRFGVLLVDLENNFSRRVDQYPKDITEAYNLLVQHKPPPDNNNKSRRNRRRERRRPYDKKGRTYWPNTRHRSIMGSRAATVERKDTMMETVYVLIKEKRKETWTYN